jgi:hypothetical protein
MLERESFYLRVRLGTIERHAAKQGGWPRGDSMKLSGP